MVHSLRRSAGFVAFLWCLLALYGLGSPSWASLRLTKSAPTTVAKSQAITYALTVTNGGSRAVHNVTVMDVPPSNTTCRPGSASDGGTFSGNQATFHVGTLASGVSRTMRYSVQVPDSTKVGTVFTSGSALATADDDNSTASGTVSTTLTNAVVLARTLVPGNIVYTSRHNSDLSRQVYLIGSDRSGQTELTDNQSLFHASPALSADGTMVTFIAAQNVNGPYHLYVMKAEPESGNNIPIQLTDSSVSGSVDPGPNAVPGWSPNGKQIVYTSPFSIGLITDLTPQSPTHLPVYLGDPSGGRDLTFGPDGHRLAYSKTPEDGSTNAIYTIGLTLDSNGLVTGDNDTPVRVATGTGSEYAPTWSPDGGKIAFVQQPAAEDSESVPDLYYVNLLNSTITRLTTGQNVFSGTIAWSPNGTNIVFNSDGPSADTEGTPSQGVDAIDTIRAVPATGQDGTNYPFRLTNVYTSYNPRYAQVSGPAGITSSLSKDASALGSADAASISAVPPGASFYYRIRYTITNSSSSALTGITIKDNVPTGTSYVAGADALEFDNTGGKRVVFNLGTVAANSTISGTSIFEVKLNSDVAENDTIHNPGTKYFISLADTQVYGQNDVNLFVTSTQFPALKLQKTLLKRNGNAVTSPNVSIARGDKVTYLLSTSNGSFGSASNITVTDPIPSGLTGTSVSFTDQNGTTLAAPPGFTATLGGTPQTATFSIKGLSGASTAYAVVNATVGSDVADNTVITNTASLSADESPTLAASQRNTVGAGTPTKPTLALSKSVYSIGGNTSAPTGTVIPGDSVLYLLKYTDAGAAATNVTITDPAPANTRISSIAFSDAKGNRIDPPSGANGDLTAADGKAIFTFKNIPAGTTGYVAITVLVNNDAASKASQISNTGYTLTADGGVSLTNLPAITNPLRAPVTISKKMTQLNGQTYGGTAAVKPGDVLTYAITVTNPNGSGATTAKNLTVTDFLPQNTTLKSAGTGTYNAASPPSVSFSVASLNVGASSTQTFSVTVDKTAGTSVVNKDYGVIIGGINRRFTGASVTTPITGGATAALTVSKALTVIETGSTTQVAPGQTVREIVTVSNTGTSAQSNVNLVVAIPGATAYSAAYLGTPNAPTTGAAPQVTSGGVTYNFGTLAAGASASATLEVQVKYGVSDSKIKFGADVVISDQTSAKDSSVSLSVTSKGAPTPPDLTVEVTARSQPDTTVEKVGPGDKVTLVFTSKNRNNSVARGVVLRFRLPSISTGNGTTPPTIVEGSSGYSLDDGIVTFPPVNLGAASTASLTFIVPQNAKIGSKIEISDYELDAANVNNVAAQGKPLTLTVVTAAVPDPGVLLDSSVDKAQPRTKDGRLEPPARISYQVLGTNNGDGAATSTDLVVPIPTGTTYIDGTARTLAKSDIASVPYTLTKDGTGRVTAVHFAFSTPLASKDTFGVGLDVTLGKDAPRTLTKIENAATLTFKAGDKSYTQKSNTDSLKVFIPAPPPAHLAVEAIRPKFAVRNQSFTTTFVVRNNGGEAAHNVILRYSLNVFNKHEIFVSASDGGTGVGPERLPSTVIWTGEGSSQAGKFATLNPGDQIVVTMTSASDTDSSVKLLTGSVFDAHEKTTPALRPILPSATPSRVSSCKTCRL